MNTADSTAPLLGRCKEKGCNYALFATREDVRHADSLKEVKAGTGAYRVNNGTVARCVNGHKVFPLRTVKGTYSPDHKCDSRCLNAKGHECTCSCGGANHGRGHAVTVVTAADAPVESPATDKQLAFIRSLIAQKLDGETREKTEARLEQGLTKKLASAWIERLKDMS